MDEGCKRSIAVWHRRAGKDKTFLNYQVARAYQRRGYYPYFFPTTKMGRRILWEGMDRTGFRFRDHFPREIVKRINESEMLIELTNGSIWQIIGTDHIDNVGINPIGCVFCEFSLQNPRAWDLVRPILAENDGWAAFNFTPRGKNHAYDLVKMGQANDKWFSEILTVDSTHAVSLDAIQDERESGMSEDMVQQEFYCSFLLGAEGSYYGKFMAKALTDGRLTTVPYDPAALVVTAWDLGVGDDTTIWFAQVIGTEIHLIDFYSTSGEGLAHYVKVLEDMRQERGWTYLCHIAPHDIEVRELATGISRREFAQQLGLEFEVLPRLPLQDGIEAARTCLPLSWFDEQRCAQGIKCLENYRKRFDEKNNVYSVIPLHDWSSHAADAFRYLALGIRSGLGVPGGDGGGYDDWSQFYQQAS